MTTATKVAFELKGESALGIDNEEQLLGALLVRPVAFPAVIAETGLRPEHFTRRKHELVFGAIARLAERDEGIDALTVADQLEREGKLSEIPHGKAGISELASLVGAPGNVMTYASRVAEDAQWRLRIKAGLMAAEAGQDRDHTKLARAEELLRVDIAGPKGDVDREAQADIVYGLLEGREIAEFPYPFPALNRATAGGMRRGQLIAVSGYSNFGKSIFVDQILDHVWRHGKKPWLYLNEMTPEERVARKVNRMAGVPYSKLINGNADDEERARALDLCNRGLAWDMTPISGWSPEKVCHHIRRTRPDVAAIDLLNRFDWENEREVSRFVNLFDATAKRAECALILVCQLNERPAGAARERSKAVFPPPVYTDLKGTGDIKNTADHVLFVHRQQDEDDGRPLSEGAIYFGKVRGGRRGGLKVRFNEARLAFEHAPDLEHRNG